jgi:hypothetical protein
MSSRRLAKSIAGIARMIDLGIEPSLVIVIAVIVGCD